MAVENFRSARAQNLKLVLVVVLVLQSEGRYCINQARGQDDWILAKFSFCVFMDREEVEVHKNAKRERCHYPDILTEITCSIKDLLYGIGNTEEMIFVRVYFRSLKRKPVICKSHGAFRFSRFLVPSRQRNHGKSFYPHGKHLAKEHYRTPASTSAKCYCGNKTGNLGHYRSILPARLVNHSAGFGSCCPLAELAI